MDCYVVRTGVGYGTEIQMGRSISGRLQWRQYFRERETRVSQKNETFNQWGYIDTHNPRFTRRSIDILNVGRCKNKINNFFFIIK